MAEIEELARSNEAPSTDLILKIKELMVKPSKELSAIDAERQILWRRLAELAEKRKEITKTLEPYAKVLSPVRRLPFEVLQEIFLWCQPTDRYPKINSEEAPLLLGAICRNWREASLSCPRLWSKLQLPYLDNNLPTVYLDAMPRVRYQIEQRCKVAREWLSRSKECPLSLSIFKQPPGHDQMFVRQDFDDRSNSFHQIVLSTIAPFLHKCKVLKLHGIFEEIDELVLPEALQQLRTLTIVGGAVLPMPRTSIIRNRRPKNLLQAPNLRAIVVDMPLWTYRDLRLVSSNFSVLNLGRVKCEHGEALEMLQRLPRLTHCRLTLCDAPNEGHFQPIDISLPRLIALFINEDANSANTETFLTCIDAPSLQDLGYMTHIFNIFRLQATTNISRGLPFPPLVLLQRLQPNNIKKMSLCYGLDYIMVQRCFQMTPLVTFLSVGDTSPSGISGTWQPIGGHVPPQMPSERTLDYFDLDSLIVPESNGTDGREVLLPNLVDFEAHFPASITDESVLQFVLSRLKPNSSRGVAILRSVKINFTRRMQLDISPHIIQRAQEAGVVLDLNLSYNVSNMNIRTAMFSL